MKIALISERTIDRDMGHNLKKIQDHAEKLSQKVDMISFGEAYLHGFNALTWDYSHDKRIALSFDSKPIKIIRDIARINEIAISFGYFEHDELSHSIYCSYIVIDKQGEVIDHYRRVSIGWKEYKKTDKHYQEGEEVHTFNYLGKNIVVALCGDLWYDKIIDEINLLEKDIILWPVHIDYDIDQWQKEKSAYIMQAQKFNSPLLMINNISDTSYGGCLYFLDGQIKDELTIDQVGTLIIDF